MDSIRLAGVSREEAIKALGKRYPELPLDSASCMDLDYYAWPQTFGSTAGPFGGVGGQAITTFTIEAWEYNYRFAVIFCGTKIIKVTDKFEPMKAVH